MRKLITPVLFFCILSACSEHTASTKNNFIIANGQMPGVVKDKDNTIHLVYGSGDSILYCYSTDNAASFSKPAIISVLPDVYTFASRGPQIAVSAKGLIVTACTSPGNIYSFYKEDGGKWIQGRKVNDVDTIAKEGLMGLGADGDNTFAVWLDLRGNAKNKIYGAASKDGGKTWSANTMVYTSPDTTVCECCKPSVLVKGNDVFVMFRNQLQGNRDLYLVQSTDGGNKFGQAQKLGTGTWKLDACPMDGGGLTVNNDGKVQTVWRREGKIFAAEPGQAEQQIGEGKGCTMETVGGKNIYAWSEKGEVVIVNPQGEKKVLGKGSQPVLRTINNDQVLCVWESEKQIHASVVKL